MNYTYPFPFYGADPLGMTLPNLPYAYNALESWIDGATMELHHTKHHQAYLENAKKAVTAHPEHAMRPLEHLVCRVGRLKDQALRDNLGGHFNHSIFWKMVSPQGGGEPSAYLKQALMKGFGGMEEFKRRFSEAAMARFGAGWAWLTWKEDGSLEVVSTANQDSPIMDIGAHSEVGIPLLGLDLWEHAYYLRYQNRRKEYVENFWKVVHWPTVEAFLRRARQEK